MIFTDHTRVAQCLSSNTSIGGTKQPSAKRYIAPVAFPVFVVFVSFKDDDNNEDNDDDSFKDDEKEDDEDDDDEEEDDDDNEDVSVTCRRDRLVTGPSVGLSITSVDVVENEVASSDKDEEDEDDEDEDDDDDDDDDEVGFDL